MQGKTFFASKLGMCSLNLSEPFGTQKKGGSDLNLKATPPNDLDVPYVAPAFLAPAFDSFEDLFDNTISEPISQVSVANETITSIQSAASQALINEKKMNKRDVDFARPEWNKGPWNSGLTNAVLFDQVLYENDPTNLLNPPSTSLWSGNLEPLAQEIRDRALDVISMDGRPFSMFSTEAMKLYSATCAKIGAAYAKAGIQINPNTIVPSRFTLSRVANNLHEGMLNSIEWQEFVTATSLVLKRFRSEPAFL
ncbi:hypothetical protein Ddc_17198 [Ditylenchus destructor]|nr:hypothetical protein Ddc_17198 [Ditylenchus destructor]